jgi:hypothetical protein
LLSFRALLFFRLPCRRAAARAPTSAAGRRGSFRPPRRPAPSLGSREPPTARGLPLEKTRGKSADHEGRASGLAGKFGLTAWNVIFKVHGCCSRSRTCRHSLYERGVARPHTRCTPHGHSPPRRPLLLLLLPPLLPLLLLPSEWLTCSSPSAANAAASARVARRPAAADSTAARAVGESPYNSPCSAQYHVSSGSAAPSFGGRPLPVARSGRRVGPNRALRRRMAAIRRRLRPPLPTPLQARKLASTYGKSPDACKYKGTSNHSMLASCITRCAHYLESR